MPSYHLVNGRSDSRQKRLAHADAFERGILDRPSGPFRPYQTVLIPIVNECTCPFEEKWPTRGYSRQIAFSSLFSQLSTILETTVRETPSKGIGTF